MANVKSRTKAQRALDLRTAGIQWDSIAKEVGYNSPQAACKAVHDLLRKVDKETAEQYRKVGIARLDSLLSMIWDRVLQGDPSAVAVALKIEDRRSKLLGLDKPNKVSLTDAEGEPISVQVYIPANNRDVE